MTDEIYDCIVIGSGAGGGAAAYRLGQSGARVLLLEKGTHVPRSADTLDPAVVIEEGRYKSTERWRDARDRSLVPEEYFNVGGKTKWYGAALMRAAAHEFGAEPDFACMAWPCTAQDLEPWYAQAEALLGVRTFACEHGLARIADRLRQHGWRAAPLPMGLAEEILAQPDEASHFDGFASPRALKRDAEFCLIEDATRRGTIALRTGAPVVALRPADRDPGQVGGVELADGTRIAARHIVLAAGALHSPRLLLRYLDEYGMTGLPCFPQVGRNLKLHLLTALVALGVAPQRDLLRKTTAFLHAGFPHSSVQPLGFDADLIGRLIPAFVPRALASVLGRHAYGFFLQTEDGSHPDNRVRVATDGTPILDYDAARCPALATEHRRLVRRFQIDLLRSGYVAFAQRIPVTGTAHVCGTLAASRDPARGVVDASGAVHGLRGLYVADGSVMPRSGRVNPSLTIYAWALKVAAGLAPAVAGGK